MSQSRLSFNDYEGFVEKFKPKKTTDDCYTPQAVYDAVCAWVEREYGVNRDSFVRPFWPGGDYEAFDYPACCCVVDNPPFSMLARIKDFYLQRGIKFFLFAPQLTVFSGYREGTCCIPCDADITYENGAVVRTAFVTNMDDCMARSCPDLKKLVESAAKVERKPELPKYSYPDEVLTASMMAQLAKGGEDFRVHAGEGCRLSALDSQRAHGKTIFGGGLLVNEERAAEKRAAEKREKHRLELSERERALVAMLHE